MLKEDLGLKKHLWMCSFTNFAKKHSRYDKVQLVLIKLTYSYESSSVEWSKVYEKGHEII